jgi:ankyrin repeat protein
MVNPCGIPGDQQEKTVAAALRIVSINQTGGSGNTALHDAAISGNLENAKALITAGIDLNIRNKNRETALLLALQNRNAEIAQLLIDSGANVHLHADLGTYQWGVTHRYCYPLNAAIRMGDKKIVKSLIDHHINVNEPSGEYSDRPSPLFVAYSHKNREIINMIEAAGGKDQCCFCTLI